MRRIITIVSTVGVLLGGLFVGYAVQPAAATTPSTTAPFNECVPVGADTSCDLLIIINPGGGITVLDDTNQGPFDGGDDTMLGVYNNSGGTVNFIDLAGTTDIFGFEGDGICGGFNPAPPACPYGTTGYEGPNTSFSNIANAGKTGRVNFTGGLANQGTTYFSLEEALTAASLNPCTAPFTPSRTITGNVPGSVTVTGQTLIDNAQIGGSVSVAKGADVFIKNSTVNGGLNSNGAHSVGAGNSTIKGSSTVSGTTGFVGIGTTLSGCQGNTWSGTTFSGNLGGLGIDKNTFTGGVTVSANKVASGSTTFGGAPAVNEISGNTINGGLTCSSNVPVASNAGVSNNVSGSRSGECVSKTF